MLPSGSEFGGDKNMLICKFNPLIEASNGQGQRRAALSEERHLHAAYTYDSENRLSVVSNSAFSVSYAYANDGWGAGYTVTLTNGTILSRAVTRDPYRRGLVKTITNAVDGVPVNPLAYNYDLLTRVTSRNSDAFGYNARSEVSSAIIAPNHTNHYEYDNIGNNLWMSVNTATNLYTSNPLNQYTNIAYGATLEPVYDLDGNLTWDGRLTYAWDAENRLAVHNIKIQELRHSVAPRRPPGQRSRNPLFFR